MVGVPAKNIYQLQSVATVSQWQCVVTVSEYHAVIQSGGCHSPIVIIILDLTPVENRAPAIT